MKHITRLLCLTIAVSFLAGCGKKIEGRYVAEPDIPVPSMASFDSKSRKQMEDVLQKARDMNRMVLDFKGSKVWMGSPASMTEYRYKVKDDRLELVAESGGMKSVIPMTIEADGSITYVTLRFFREQ